MDNGASSYRRFLEGDRNALTEIIKDYKDGLILYLNGFTGNIYVSEELAQDVFVRLYVKKPHFSGKSSFKTWLYAIAGNMAIDYLRKSAKEKSTSLDEIGEIPDDFVTESAYFKKENSVILHNAMSALKNEYYQVLWLTYFEGFSNKETAKIIKKTLKNTEVLLVRARKALKKELESEGFSCENL